ncbi:ABC transporter permease [Actinomadura citrea]|uniref:NitT/TauT family transport system permease protein n=1 Tax=Actinomadura citrea TaxID=46158 RepID=A0A7Y9GEA8_9ACTN|nr:ABC transporter permease [Actinomadura citrea]NYE14896.1 NitT/TauT family transport system permease protein [Actinomadura citrea]GGU08558.1 amino acid ABC transporter permease [Actinomadura citrea]
MTTDHVVKPADSGAGGAVAADEPWVRALRRAERRRTALVWALRLAVAAVILVAWQVIGKRDPLFTSYPTAVVQAAWDEVTSGTLGGAMAKSFEILVLGLLAGVVIGIVAGLIIGRYSLVASSVEWIVSALNATPLLAIIPLLIVWFGLGFQSKVVTVFVMTVFSMLLNTAAGVHEVDTNVLDVSRAFVASESQVFRKIILPSAVPFIMTGLRISIGRALIGTVAAEFFTGVSGLGGLIQKYGASYQTDYMLVPVLTLMLLGVLLTGLARWLENVVAPWRDRRR